MTLARKGHERPVSRWFGHHSDGRRSRLLDRLRRPPSHAHRPCRGPPSQRRAAQPLQTDGGPAAASEIVDGPAAPDGRRHRGWRRALPQPGPARVAMLAGPTAVVAAPVGLDARGDGLPYFWHPTVGAPPGGVWSPALVAVDGLPLCDGRLGDGLPVCDGRSPAVVGDGRRPAREQRGEGAHGPRYGRKVVNGLETTAVGEADQRQAKMSYGSGVGSWRCRRCGRRCCGCCCCFWCWCCCCCSCRCCGCCWLLLTRTEAPSHGKRVHRERPTGSTRRQMTMPVLACPRRCLRGARNPTILAWADSRTARQRRPPRTPDSSRGRSCPLPMRRHAHTHRTQCAAVSIQELGPHRT